jgi:uncharacterized SAM-binding protein YcdF (DUF218 family)
VALLYAILTGNGYIGRLTAFYLQSGYISKNSMEYANTDSIPIPKIIVVLGGGITKFQETETPHVLSYSRIAFAYQLYHRSVQTGQACKIIVSGFRHDRGYISEARLFANALENMSVPSSDIIIEDKSHNTYENAIYTSRILKENHTNTAGIITAGIHMRRAVTMFKSVGITCIPLPSDFVTTETSFVPSGYNCAITSLMLHEIVGLMQFRLYNRLGLNNGQEKEIGLKKR